MANIIAIFPMALCALVFSYRTNIFVAGGAEIEPSLSPSALADGATANVIVTFVQKIESVIDEIDRRNITNSTEKRTTLTEAQEAFSTRSQAPLAAVLRDRGVTFETLWINNRMYIPNANAELIQTMSEVSGVARIEKEKIYPVEWTEASAFHNVSKRQSNPQIGLSWGVQQIRSNRVWWSHGGGSGIVVANIDTGVRHTHESLASRWRSSYGWFDPYKGLATPQDDGGHGTHCMGTMAGSNRIGVAPHATWIACKGCQAQGCGASQLMKCAQWIQCPTKPDGSERDCSKAPNVVSNSYAGGQGESAFDSIVRSWHASNIIPVFAMGNLGKSGCGTALSPGDGPNVIGVGSTNPDERISFFSSQGPTVTGRIKPDIVAPGFNIWSASHTSDTAYVNKSGTSMACPHVSGVVALMLQKNRKANYTMIYNAITKSAVRTLDTSTAQNCGGISPNVFPNNVFGYGRIDAVNAINALPA